MSRPGRSKRPVIICFAGDVWEGRPHSRHHLMRRLAGDYEVLWIDGAFVRSLSRLDRGQWQQLLRKLRGFSLRTVEPHLHVLRPLPIPPAGRLGRQIWLKALAVQVRLALRWLRLGGGRLTWFSLPTVAPLLGRLGEEASLFYYQDRYDEFPHVDVGQLRGDIRALAQGCDACVASAGPLAEDLRAHGVEAVVVRHGVDVSRFAGDPDPPEDLAALERPLVGYVGRVGDHMWQEAVVAVADRLEHGTVVLVGDASTDLSALRHPRIRLLGHRPAASMPAYVAAFDCCMIPFIQDRLTEAVNPIKLREYLGAGRPVVATPLPEVATYADVVSLAGSPEAFGTAVMEILDDPDADSDEKRERRRARVAGETWDAAATRVAGVLEPLLPPWRGG